MGLARSYLVRVEWTPALYESLSVYLLWENNHLRKLSWRLPNEELCRSVSSAAILAALDRPEQQLEDFCIDGCFVKLNFDQKWLEKVYFIVRLNCQRRRHGPRLSTIATAEQLVEALQEIDRDYLVEFLRRNEFNVPALLQKFGGSA